MSSSVSTTVGGVVVVTHVHPVPQNGGNNGQQHYVGINKFSRNSPLVLGTIQIMSGLLFLLFGIVMALDADSMGVFSGIFVWGALTYVAAGSLTVAAGKRLTRCLVIGALSVSVVAAVFSLTGTILHSMDAAGILLNCYNYPPYPYEPSWICYNYQVRTQGFSGVLAFLSLLEFITSITVVVYASKASCTCCETPQLVVENARSSVIMPSTQVPGVQVAQHPAQVQVNYPKSPQEPGANDFPGPPSYTAALA